ncbi:MAG: penicillin-binding protein [Bifidobacteriaceae bacterium]|jgi:membrane peptidoglycan carboxypeptidase|nr:penicillin-binding protein [Bifidobacteriaceae bacterium]
MARKLTSGEVTHDKILKKQNAGSARRISSSSDLGGGEMKKTKGSKTRGSRKKKLSKGKIALRVVLFSLLGLFVIGAATLGILFAITDIPTPQEMATARDNTVYYADGKTVLGVLRAENKEVIECGNLPEHLKRAVVASEDRNFYSNWGIDPIGIARALYNNLTTGSKQGGSTITQQYAERYYMGSATTIPAKFKEALLSLKISATQNKDTILCNYMNIIFFGRGTFGIESAAKAFFGKSASELDYSQSALLAGIIPAPSAWDPAVNLDMATARWKRVLEIMLADGHITQQQFNDAKFPKTVKVANQSAMKGPNGYLLDMVRKELTSLVGLSEAEVIQGGYKIVSTVDKKKQDAMIKAAESLPDDAPKGLQVGGVSLDPKTGGIFAGYGGHDFSKVEFNNITQAKAQAGSTFKAFALLGAIQQKISMHSTFDGNSPQSYPGLAKPVNNANGTSYGTIDLYRATAFSVNTVFLHLTQQIGSNTVAKNAVSAGIGMKEEDIDNVGVLDAIGIASVSPLQLATAYNTFASGGKLMTSHIISTIDSNIGDNVYQFIDDSIQVFDAGDIALLTDVLRAPPSYGFATLLQNLNRPIAGKSGTTDDMKSAWFAGYTPQVTATFGIWLPGENGEVLSIPEFSSWNGAGNAGSGFPTQAFDTYMLEGCADLPVEQFPTPPVTAQVSTPTPTPKATKTPKPKPTPTEKIEPEPVEIPDPEPPAVVPPVEPTPTPTPPQTSTPEVDDGENALDGGAS